MDQDAGSENCASRGKDDSGEVHLVVQRPVKLIRGNRERALPMDDISGDNAGAPETDADGFGTGRELALLGEVAYFLVDRFWNFIEPGITLQHQPHVSVTLQEAGDRTQRAGAHQVVVAHEEAELASGFLYQAADIAIVAKIGFVLE